MMQLTMAGEARMELAECASCCEQSISSTAPGNSMHSSEGYFDAVVGHCFVRLSHRPSVRAVVCVRAADCVAAAIAYLVQQRSQL